MNTDDLHCALRGALIHQDDAGYATAREGLLFNGRRPDRHPRLIARVADVADVQALVRFAAAQRLPISVRGSGHNWSGIALQDGVVLDLGALDSIRIDAAARVAEVGLRSARGPNRAPGRFDTPRSIGAPVIATSSPEKSGAARSTCRCGAVRNVGTPTKGAGRAPRLNTRSATLANLGSCIRPPGSSAYRSRSRTSFSSSQAMHSSARGLDRDQCRNSPELGNRAALERVG